MTAALIEVRGLSVAIGGRTVVSDVDFALGNGERLAVLGRNGAGKTTLLHTLAGLRKPLGGSIRLCGEQMSALAPRRIAQLRGVLLQQQIDAFPASVLETALVGRHPWLERWAWESAADARTARAALAAVGLADLEERDVHTLSGGERQRLALATLLTQEPQLALLDEPLSHLDLNHQIAVLQLLGQRARDAGMGMITVMHDVNLARRHADRALLLFGDGRVEQGPVADVLNATTLTQLYGHPLRRIDAGGSDYFIPE
ncbi:MAG: ABC transporter ATP-binding protein [Rhodocyclales bacterium]|nr:ABC transporter ATP-binding protein [Rhodocyclales bacterium]